jgi:signal transduction histidine kinase
MRLSEFIQRNMEVILVQWEEFSSTQLPAAATMDSLALRDHAQAILLAVAADLSSPQTAEAQAEKSKGRAPKLFDAPETAAQTHGLLRAQSGFDINQLAAEYRALRANVLRLWIEDCHPEAPHLNDIIRFNEAIDQALAESISFYSMQVDQARNLLLGMLGHDMRSPLQAIQLTALSLAELNAGGKVSESASRLIRSGARMKALLDDLLDFSRSKLGLGIRIAPTDVDVANLLAEGLDELRVAYPQHRLELEVSGNCTGLWDGLRLQQLLDNLVVNAIKYGSRDAPVRVVVTDQKTHLHIDVKNIGPAIDRATLDEMFNPLERGSKQPGRHDEVRSMGLGLYIAREIATAHGGTIDARSDDTETAFSVCLPRWQQLT